MSGYGGDAAPGNKDALTKSELQRGYLVAWTSRVITVKKVPSITWVWADAVSQRHRML
jgi:hypothetical protein